MKDDFIKFFDSKEVIHGTIRFKYMRKEKIE